MIETMREQDLYAADFERFIHSPGGGTLEATRRAAFDRFTTLGFPTTKHEEWRFTNVTPIARTAFALAGPDGPTVRASGLDRVEPVPGDWPRFVFVDGHYADELSSRQGLPDAVTAGGLAGAMASGSDVASRHLTRHASYETHPFTALNTAFMADQAFECFPDLNWSP